MAIVEWDPEGSIAALQNRINQLFRDSFPCHAEENGSRPRCSWTPLVDVVETAAGIVVTADLPGVKKQDVMVEVKSNTLTISGRRTAEIPQVAHQYLRQERFFGTFCRSFTSHTVIAPESITARFKDGVLVVEIPKPDEETARQISVDVKSGK